MHTSVQCKIRVKKENGDACGIYESFVRNILWVADGLAICKGIIEAHNGHIMAESELGKGSTFIFRLEKWSK